MMRFLVVSSRIFVWPLSVNAMSGGRLRSASSLRTSFDASSSAWPGAMSATMPTENCRFARCSWLGPEPAFEPGDVVDADGRAAR